MSPVWFLNSNKTKGFFVMADSGFVETLGAVGLAIVGVATLAVIVSRNSNTTGVIGAAGSAFSQSLGTALSPITGGNSQYASGWAGLSGSGVSTFPIG
jgi:PRD1 phage membrane DNA delivery